MSRGELQVGETIKLKGFFGKALYLRMQTACELERRLGYRPGRLAQGWWLLFLTRKPAPADFEFAGYSHLSGGVVQGHLDSPADRRGANERLLDSGHDVARLKKTTLEKTFRLAGSERLAKVIPVGSEHRTPGIPDYPQGSGIPQWKLVNPLPWRVAAFIGPGERYTGYYT